MLRGLRPVRRQVDEEHDVTEYCAKRLLRGCCKREGGTRIGSALAIALLLKAQPLPPRLPFSRQPIL